MTTDWETWVADTKATAERNAAMLQSDSRLVATYTDWEGTPSTGEVVDIESDRFNILFSDERDPIWMRFDQSGLVVKEQS